MRARIAELPDGSFEYQTYAETGIATADLLIRSTITISGDEMVVDYEGRHLRRESGVNCVLNCTRSLTLFPLHAALLPDIPSNEGAAAGRFA
jgi:N-methylhydantoinase B/oxoprolinase/acetone carboxylase alpha subunit